MQLGENVHRPVDWPGHHFIEPSIEGVNQLGFVRVLLLQQPSGVGDEATRILAAVPFLRADGRQEMLHRRFVTIEQLAVEIAGIPIDEDPAEVKDHYVAMTHVAHCMSKTGSVIRSRVFATPLRAR